MSDPGASPGSEQQPDPAGYWEQQAAQAAADPPPPYAYQPPQYQPPQYQPPQYQPPPYQPPQYQQAQYGQPQDPQPQYGQPPYGQPQYQQAPYGQPPFGEYAGGYTSYVRPDHPKAVTALVLGLIAGPGALGTCGLTLLLGPLAWAYGHWARKEIKQADGRYGGEGKAMAGLVIGIVTTVLLVATIASIIALAIWSSNDPTGFNDFWDNGETV